VLEHVIDPNDAGRGPVPPAGPPEADHYIPKHSAETLTGSAKAPSVKRFNRKMLLIMGAVAGVVIILAFAVGLQQPKLKAPEPVATTLKPPVPNAAVNSLPGGYDTVIPPLGEPRPGDLGTVNPGIASAEAGTNPNAPPRQLTPIEQYAQQTELDRLRNEDRARGAAVSFANAGANDASAGSQVAAAAADATQLQQKLLELAQRGGGPTPGAATLGANVSARDDANRQDDKAEFVGRARDTDFELHATLQLPRSPYTLFAGTILPCVLTQGINSDLPGQIGCMISQNVYDTVTGQHLLVPQGTKVIGTYDSRIAYGQERVLVVWTRLLRPDGSTLSLEGMPGIDLSGYAGLTGHVNNHYGRLLAGVVLGSVLGASAQIAVGANSQNPSFSQLAIQGTGQNINEAGQQITRKNLNIQPTIEVPPGGRLNIFATKDLILPPWTG
jgi:type IV secretory pathway VirB10-like protein